MLRVAASWVVALVQNAQPIGDVAIGDNIGDTVRQLRCAADIQAAIAVGVLAALPGPAIRPLLGVDPKALSGSFSVMLLLQNHVRITVFALGLIVPGAKAGGEKRVLAERQSAGSTGRNWSRRHVGVSLWCSIDTIAERLYGYNQLAARRTASCGLIVLYP